MENYSDYMNEITKDELFEGLLGYGMFSEKIPPIFTSKPLYDFCIANEFDWRKDKAHFPISYESMRNIVIPRFFSIPYPTNYVNQCIILSENWDKLKNYFEEKTKTQSYKKSRIHIRKMKDKKELFEMNYKNETKDGLPKIDISIGSKYVVKADISNCFPSIYTHAISWALEGKEVAKKYKEKKYKEEWYNKIDYYTRALKDNETHGILIGPHTSNLISEIVLTAVDYELQKYGFTRHIDDYACYVPSQQEAENFLINLSDALKKYDLSLNHKKTEIIKLPLPLEELWINYLNGFDLPEEINSHFLKRYLDTAIELANRTENISVINYIVKVLSKKVFKQLAIDYYIKTIHHLLLIYPYLLPIIDKYIFEPLEIDVNTIQRIANDVYDDGKKFNRYESLSYAVYFAIKYNFELDNDLITEVQKQEDCIFMVLSYLHDGKYRPTRIIDYYNIAKDIQQNDFLKDKYWLFIYEVLSQTDLKDDSLKALKKGKVSFIKHLP